MAIVTILRTENIGETVRPLMGVTVIREVVHPIIGVQIEVFMRTNRRILETKTATAKGIAKERNIMTIRRKR